MGSSPDPQFGPVLLFGMGGQLVEVFKDRALALPPLVVLFAAAGTDDAQTLTRTPAGAGAAQELDCVPSRSGGAWLAYDQVELSNHRACLGRFYFKVPGGVAYGQHWLNVKFEQSVLRVPFRILTKEEEKFLSKNYKSIEKQVKDAFAPKKK